ncbi:MAG: DUF4340 domain-containing protein [Firmicutes bacterium]|nr:DUF4340 domain-containing protein [Bacillota bacterium]
MNKRKKVQLIVLIGIFLIVAMAFTVLKIYQKKVPGETEETNERYSVIDIDSMSVTDIGIITSDGTTNLTKETDGWKCNESPEIQIEDSKVEDFIENISTITSDTQIEDVENMEQYGLHEPGINVTLQWANNMYTIKLGDYNSTIGRYYISINDERTVYTVESSIYYSMNKNVDDFEKEEVEETE